MGLAVQIVTTAGIIITLLLTLLGGAYKFGRLEEQLSQAKTEINEIKRSRRDDEDSLKHDISKNFDKVFEKIDALPCHMPNPLKGC